MALNLLDDLLCSFDNGKEPDSSVEIQGKFMNLRIDCGNCQLRFIKESDKEQLVKMANCKDVAKYLRAQFPNPYSLQDAQEWIKLNHNVFFKQYEEAITNYRKKKCIDDEAKNEDRNQVDAEYMQIPAFFLTIAEKSKDLLIGGISLHRDQYEHHKAEFGYWLGKEYWGRGITTNALKGLVSFIWNTDIDTNSQYFNLNKELALSSLIRLEAPIAISNTGSIKVAEKNGFQKEGIRRKCQKLRDGTIVDSVCVALIRDDVTK